MKKVMMVVVAFLLGIAFLANVEKAEASSICGLLQVHNPTSGELSDPEPADTKSQFIMQNTSDDGVNISSILWTFVNPVFIDSAAGGQGFGGFRDYTVSPAETYGGGENEITVLANSDVLTGYTGPVNFTDGATSLFLTFNDFDPDEAFGFWTDLDTANEDKGHVGNSDFNGSTTKIVFSDGSEKTYNWVLPDNDGRSFYAALECCEDKNVIPEPMTMTLLGSGLIGGILLRKKQS